MAGGAEFAARLRGDDARLADALAAPGFQSPEEVSLQLQASDVALQPYPDGADTRRTSLMACLANGVPTVTTRGRFTRADVLVAAAGYPVDYEVHRVGEIAAQVYEDPACTMIGMEPGVPLRTATRAAYLQDFAVERTLERLLGEEDAA